MCQIGELRLSAAFCPHAFPLRYVCVCYTYTYNIHMKELRVTFYFFLLFWGFFLVPGKLFFVDDVNKIVKRTVIIQNHSL